LKTLLELRDLCAGFPHRPVLEGIDLSLDAGEIAVLLGPNGSGKTTLLKTACGLLKPLGGAVYLDGKDLAALKARVRARLAGFLFQDTAPPWPFTVRELLSQGRFSRQGIFGPPDSEGEELVEKVLDETGLRAFADRPATELSGGEYQRVLIGRLLVQEPRVIFLDEPVNNLDPKYQRMVMDLVGGMKDRGLAALISLHDMALARRYAGRIILLNRGGIAAQGSPGEVLRPGILEEIFEVKGEELSGK
jgi:iron complex transport system ATP-binding protein